MALTIHYDQFYRELTRAAVEDAVTKHIEGIKATHVPMPYHEWSIYDRFLGPPNLAPLPDMPEPAPGIHGCGGSCQDPRAALYLVPNRAASRSRPRAYTEAVSLLAQQIRQHLPTI